MTRRKLPTTCWTCIHSRLATWYGAPLAGGCVRCAHPKVVSGPFALISPELGKPCAYRELKIDSALDRERQHPGQRWPWEFDPDWLNGCKGYTELEGGDDAEALRDGGQDGEPARVCGGDAESGDSGIGDGRGAGGESPGAHEEDPVGSEVARG